MTRLSTSELRKDTSRILHRVARKGERIVLHRKQEDLAVLVSLEDAALLEAVEDRMDLEEIREAREEVAREGTVPWEEVRRILPSSGFA